MTFTLSDRVFLYKQGILINSDYTNYIPKILRKNNFIGKTFDQLTPNFYGFLDDIRIYTFELFFSFVKYTYTYN